MTHPTTKVITAQTAQQVLFHFGHKGIQAGSFYTALYNALTAADSENLALLALGYPGEAAAVSLIKNAVRGVEVLEAIAKDFQVVENDNVIHLHEVTR